MAVGQGSSESLGWDGRGVSARPVRESTAARSRGLALRPEACLGRERLSQEGGGRGGEGGPTSSLISPEA